MSKRRDFFQAWVDTGRWPEYRNFLKECKKYNYTDKEICRRLNVTQATLVNLKKKHPEISEAMEEGILEQKVVLINNIMKLACGYDEIVDTKLIKSKSGKVTDEKVIQQNVRHIGPDLKANIYLLTVHFGGQYSSQYEQLKLAREKFEKDKEEWNNARGIKEDSVEEAK